MAVGVAALAAVYFYLTAVYFLLREFLADYGAWSMIRLGTLAIVAMLAFPRGVWGLVAGRWDLRFFPVRRRERPELPPPAAG